MRGSCPHVLCERLPPLQAAKVASHPWIHFYVDAIVWIILSDVLVLFFHFTCEWTRVSSEVDFTDGISTESPVCHGALQLNQVISPCETSCWLSCITGHTRTPNARWPEGKYARGGTQFNSFSLHSHSSKRSLPLHASYCCMWLICFPFSTAKVKQVSNVYKKVMSSITGASNNTSLENSLTFKQETFPLRDANNMQLSSIFKQDTTLNRPKLTCIAFYAFLITLSILLLLHGLRII